MSDDSEFDEPGINRRDFIARVSAAAGYCLLNCETFGQSAAVPKIVRALDDSGVVHGTVTFQSGEGENSINEEYILNATAMLAQKGFVGIAPNIFSLQKDSMTVDEKRKVFSEQITDEHIFADLQAAIDYLKQQDFASTKKIGITGFCFGGRCALMFAAESRAVGAVAPFYGNLRTPAFAKRKQDPLDILDKIRVPVQGHYALYDPEIPADQIAALKAGLKRRHTPVEIFTYTAKHGFFAYTRPSYDAAAAQLAWQRTSEFFRRTLGR